METPRDTAKQFGEDAVLRVARSLSGLSRDDLGKAVRKPESAIFRAEIPDSDEGPRAKTRSQAAKVRAAAISAIEAGGVPTRSPQPGGDPEPSPPVRIERGTDGSVRLSRAGAGDSLHLSAARYGIGWSQEDLAKRSGISRATLALAESSRDGASVGEASLDAIARAFRRRGVGFERKDGDLVMLIGTPAGARNAVGPWFPAAGRAPPDGLEVATRLLRGDPCGARAIVTDEQRGTWREVVVPRTFTLHRLHLFLRGTFLLLDAPSDKDYTLDVGVLAAHPDGRGRGGAMATVDSTALRVSDLTAQRARHSVPDPRAHLGLARLDIEFLGLTACGDEAFVVDGER